MNVGVIAGSFDPVTNGHLWLIKESAKMVDKLFIVVANNTAKKTYFTYAERLSVLRNAIDDELSHTLSQRIQYDEIEYELLVNWATEHGVTHMFRGIRNIQDFEYEQSMRTINLQINPDIETVFFLTPPDKAQISSSIVKGLVGLNNWENVVKKFVPSSVVKAFTIKRHLERNQ
jgi:pantetheine-phosphate adenylyltransferase